VTFAIASASAFYFELCFNAAIIWAINASTQQEQPVHALAQPYRPVSVTTPA
jgi:hypothetical protein